MSSSDLSLLVRKLECSGKLSTEDIDALLALPFTTKSVRPGAYLVREGDPPEACSILLTGFAFRHKLAGDGGRQIVALHIPGEAIDLQSLYLNRADHNAQTLTEAAVAIIPMRALRELMDERPAIVRAVLLDMLIEASILREWIMNIGRRDARTRLAHLLCEFATRLSAQGLGSASYELPMTQEQLGDALGLTSVHVNRSIRSLEADGLLRRDKRMLSFPDIVALRHAGDFNSLYLHLDQGPTLT